VHRELMSDIEGLTNTVPPFSRRGFMTASAATAAGYTLLAGPVRADVTTTDTAGLTAGEAKIKVADGEMPGYFAKPANVANPQSVPAMTFSRPTSSANRTMRCATRSGCSM